VSQEKWAIRVAKLLRKAESTTPEEAELLTAKAQEIMTSWALSDALIARASGDNNKEREQVIQKTTLYRGGYSRALFQIGSAVSRANNCKALISKAKQQNLTFLHIIGFESDVERVLFLDSSLQVQAATALRAWWKQQETDWMSAPQKFKTRREFFYGFANGVESLLTQARRAGEREAIANEADRAETTLEEAGDSVALVIREKKAAVDEWIDKTYGKLRPDRGTRRTHGGYAAQDAGYAAGRSADVGFGRVGSGPKALVGA